MNSFNWEMIARTVFGSREGHAILMWLGSQTGALYPEEKEMTPEEALIAHGEQRAFWKLVRLSGVRIEANNGVERTHP